MPEQSLANTCILLSVFLASSGPSVRLSSNDRGGCAHGCFRYKQFEWRFGHSSLFALEWQFARAAHHQSGAASAQVTAQLEPHFITSSVILRRASMSRSILTLNTHPHTHLQSRSGRSRGSSVVSALTLQHDQQLRGTRVLQLGNVRTVHRAHSTGRMSADAEA